MKRRFLSAMLSVVMAASLVTGCAGSSSGTADTKAEDVKADTKDNNGTEAGEKDTQGTQRIMAVPGREIRIHRPRPENRLL